MTEGDVTAAYIDMGGVKVRGKDVPRPVRSWAQCGLPLPILGTLKRHLYREPLPIQALALPIIMSGRDCIGVATTGSGKTLGFVLPMLRHVNDQVVRGLDETLGNGPVGLIIAPTRELVQQARPSILAAAGTRPHVTITFPRSVMRASICTSPRLLPSAALPGMRFCGSRRR